MRTVTIFNRKKFKIAGKMRIIITAKISILGHPNVFKFIQIIVTPFYNFTLCPSLNCSTGYNVPRQYTPLF